MKTSQHFGQERLGSARAESRRGQIEDLCRPRQSYKPPDNDANHHIVVIVVVDRWLNVRLGLNPVADSFCSPPIRYFLSECSKGRHNNMYCRDGQAFLRS